MFCCSVVRSQEDILGGAFPSDFQEHVQRAGRGAIKCSPVIDDRCAGDPEEPASYALRTALGIEMANRFQEDLRGQIFGHFPILHLDVDEVVDTRKILLIERQKFLSVRVDLLLCCAHIHCFITF